MKKDFWTTAGAFSAIGLFGVSLIFSFTLFQRLVGAAWADRIAMGLASVMFETSKALLWVRGLQAPRMAARRWVFASIAVAFAALSITASAASILTKFDQGDQERAGSDAVRIALESQQAQLTQQINVEVQRLSGTDTAYVKSPEATRESLRNLRADLERVAQRLEALPAKSSVRSTDLFASLRVLAVLQNVDLRSLYALGIVILIDLGAFATSAASIRRKAATGPLIVESEGLGAHYVQTVRGDGSVQTYCGRLLSVRIVPKATKTLCVSCSNLYAQEVNRE